MTTKINAQIFVQWANDNLNFQNESTDYKLIALKEFKDMFYKSTQKHNCLAFIDGRNNKVLKDIDVLNIFNQ